MMRVLLLCAVAACSSQPSNGQDGGPDATTSDATASDVTSPDASAPDASAPTPWLLEDFSTYTSTSNLKSNPRGIYSDAFVGDGNESANTTQMSLDTTVGVDIDGYTLSQSLRYDFPVVNTSDYTIGCNLQFPAQVGEVWLELYHKFSSTFTTLGPASGNADYKFNSIRTTGPSTRFMTFAGTYGTGWQFGYPGNDEGANSDVNGYYGNSTFDFTNFGTPFDGAWHRYRYHYKIGSGTSGLAIWFYDGHRMPSFPAVDSSSGGVMYGWALGRNMNKGTSQSMSEWWGRVAFYIGDPGWGF